MKIIFNTKDECFLISKMKEGDIEAFDALYWHYQKAVFNNIFNLIKEEASSEDLLQEVFITLWEKREGIDENRSLGGWLFVSSYNRAVNFLKKKLRERIASELITEVFLQPSGEDSLKEIRMLELEKAIEKLPEQKQKVFYLCKLKGLTYAEAASTLRISKNTVKEHLSGAISSIRDHMLKIPGIGLIIALLLKFS